jgi:hypothetical protein
MVGIAVGVALSIGFNNFLLVKYNGTWRQNIKVITDGRGVGDLFSFISPNQGWGALF